MNKQYEKNEREYYGKGRGKKGIVSIIAIIIAIIMLVWTVVGSLISVTAAELGDNSVKKVGMRGIWVSTIANLDYPSRPSTSSAALKKEADTIINQGKNMGMNAIFLQVRPSADAIYPSNYFPWSKYLTGTQGTAPEGGFDPLAYWVEASHKAGLELHAWINPYRVTRNGDADWNTLSRENPAKDKLADYVIKHGKNYYFDPGEPAVRQYIVDSACEIANNYAVDGIHMDDYFYPGKDFNDAISYSKYGHSQNKDDWRRDNINKLISQMNTDLHRIKNNISFGISPSGIWANKSSNPLGSNTYGMEHYSALYSDSLAWIKNGWIDYIAPQIYWSIGYKIADYRILAEWWNNAVKGTNVDLYIGMADYRAVGVKDKNNVWYGTGELERQLNLNKGLSNVKGEIHFRHKMMALDSGISNFYKNYYGKSRNMNMPEQGKKFTPTQSTGNLGVIPGGKNVPGIKKVPDNNVKNKGIVPPKNGVQNEKQNPNVNKVPKPVENKENPINQNYNKNLDNKLTYKDISGHWAEKYITELANLGIVTGMGDGGFHPDEPVTRAQFVKLVAGIISGGVIDDTKSVGFKDVPKNAWYATYVNWAANKGIISGMEDKTFHPNDKITREQMAVIIQNVSNVANVHLKTERDGISFKDMDSISEWAGTAVNKAVSAGILNGMTKENKQGEVIHLFMPKGDTTRAQSAKVISMLRELINAN